MTEHSTDRFTGSFTQQEPIPEEGIEAAVRIMRSGRLHRYNLVGDEPGETSLLELEFAASVGVCFTLSATWCYFSDNEIVGAVILGALAGFAFLEGF